MALARAPMHTIFVGGVVVKGITNATMNPELLFLLGHSKKRSLLMYAKDCCPYSWLMKEMLISRRIM